MDNAFAAYYFVIFMLMTGSKAQEYYPNLNRPISGPSRTRVVSSPYMVYTSTYAGNRYYRQHTDPRTYGGYSTYPLSYRTQEIYQGVPFTEPYATHQWGAWSNWTPCSKSCDGGAQRRSRQCKSIYKQLGTSTQPPRCSGPNQDYRACNAQECLSPKDLKKRKYSARVRQCARYNDKPYLGQMFKWIPYMRVGLDECKLNCLAEGFRMFTTFDGGMEDGTICGDEVGMQCKEGECIKIEAKIEREIVPTQPTIQRGNQVPNVERPPIRQYPGTGNPFSNQQHHLRQVVVNSPGFRVDPRLRVNPRYPPNAIFQPARRYGIYNPSNKLPEQHTVPAESKPQMIFVRKKYGQPENARLGYNPAFTIPAGAVDIFVDEVKGSRNYLALRVGGKDVINGHWRIDKSKNITVAGALIQYKIGRGGKPKELLYSKGPIDQDLQIMLLYQKDVVEISYNYSIPAQLTDVNLYPQQIIPRRQQPVINSVGGFRYEIPARRPDLLHPRVVPGVPPVGPGIDASQRRPPQGARLSPQSLPGARLPSQGIGVPLSNSRIAPQGAQKPQGPQKIFYQWQVGGMTECSVKCGGGEQEFVYRCFAVVGLTTGRFAEKSKCAHLEPPPTKKRVCNLKPCPARWVTGPWTECSKTCGQSAFQQRTVECQETRDIDNKRVDIKVPVNKCEHLPKPIETQECKNMPCFFQWKTGVWGQCSRSCGQGKRYREVYCEHTNKFKIPDVNCDPKTKPLDSMVCFEKECDTTWFASQWSTCSSACGSGTQYRHVLCTSKSGGLAAELQCSGKERPPATRGCTGTMCKDGVWMTSEWTECSNFCGAGKQSRAVFCMAEQNGQFVQVDEDKCSKTRKPVDHKRCLIRACPPLWYAGTWSECSASCGGGYQYRQRTCLLESGTSARGCQYASRPATNIECNTNTCPIETKPPPTTLPTTKSTTAAEQPPTSKPEEFQHQGSFYEQPWQADHRVTTTLRTKQNTLRTTASVPVHIDRNRDLGIEKKQNSFHTILNREIVPTTVETTKISSTKSFSSSTKLKQQGVKSSVAPSTHSKGQADVAALQGVDVQLRNRLRPYLQLPTACADRSSKAYCHVISERLNFCHIKRYNRVCCKSCKEKSKR